MKYYRYQYRKGRNEDSYNSNDILFIYGCRLHQKSTLSKVQVIKKVDKLMDEVNAFALKSEAYALEHGRELTANEMKYAKSIGVKHPKK